MVGRSDPVSAGGGSDWNTELNMNAPNAIIVPPSDTNAPPKPISSMIGGGASEDVPEDVRIDVPPQKLMVVAIRARNLVKMDAAVLSGKPTSKITIS